MGAGVVRIKGTDRALAMSVDGNGRYGISTPTVARCWRWPRRRAMSRAPARVPLGATNCLNFGNPERPAIMWQFARAVEGIGEACRALGVPITGGNVSLYNETDGKAIYPTPVIGVVGLLDHADRVVTRSFKASGEMSHCWASTRDELGASEYLKTIHGLVRATAAGTGPRSASARCRTSGCSGGEPAASFGARLLGRRHSRHTRGEQVRHGRSRRRGSLEGTRATGAATLNDAAVLFGESASRVVVSLRREDVTEVLQRAAAAGVSARVIGETGGNRLRIAVAGRWLLMCRGRGGGTILVGRPRRVV